MVNNTEEILEKLAGIGEYLAHYATLDDIYDHILSDFCDFFPDAAGGLFYLTDISCHELIFKRCKDIEPSNEGERVIIGEGPIGRAADNKEIIVGSNTPAFTSENNVNTLIAVPLELNAVVIGVVVLCFPYKESLRQPDLNLLNILARQAVNAIHCKKTYENLVYHHLLTASLQRVASAVNALDFYKVLDQVILSVQQADPENMAIIWYRSESTGAWYQHIPPHFRCLVCSFPNIADYEGIAGQALQTRQPYNCGDTMADPHYRLTLPHIRAEIAIPVVIDNQVSVVLDVQSPHKQAFGASHEKYFHLLAFLAFYAFRDRQLMSIAEQKTREMITLKTIGENLGQRQGLREILQIIAEESLRLVGHGKKIAAVMLWDHEKKMMETRAIAGAESKKYLEHLCVPVAKRSIISSVVLSRQERLVPDVRQANDYYQIVPDTRSELCVPFFFHGELLGILNLESTDIDAFDNHDVEMLKTLGESTAISTKLGELVDIRIRQLEALYRSGTKLNSTHSLYEVLHTLAFETLNALGKTFRTVYIQLYDPESEDFVIHAAAGDDKAQGYVGHRLPAMEGITGLVFREKKHYLCPDVRKDQWYKAISAAVKSELCVPIIYADKVIGVINAESLQLHDFGMYHVQLLDSMANQAGVAIENARLNDKLSSTQYELNRTMEMAFLGATLAGLSHDIRTSTTLISGEAQWIEKCYQNGALTHAETLKSMLNIKEQIKRIERMITDLSRRSKEDKPALESVNLLVLVESTLQMVRVRADQHRILLEVVRPTLNFDVYVDRSRIIRVFLNIVNNAFDAMPDGGTLFIAGTHNAAACEISFRDSGCGFPSDYLTKIWKHFYSTKEQGLGLGLTICKRIIEIDHNGTITIESQQGKGALVKISLPLPRNKGL